MTQNFFIFQSFELIIFIYLVRVFRVAEHESEVRAAIVIVKLRILEEIYSMVLNLINLLNRIMSLQMSNFLS